MLAFLPSHGLPPTQWMSGNTSALAQSITLTLREALDIPAYIKTSITLNDAFQQEALPGLATGQKIDIDTPLTITMPASSVFIYNGIDNK